jgi:Flp pilus assembly protein protease CpaA
MNKTILREKLFKIKHNKTKAELVKEIITGFIIGLFIGAGLYLAYWFGASDMMITTHGIVHIGI